MTYVPIAKGTPNWDSPLNLALTQLDNNTTNASASSLQKANNLSDLTNVPAARAALNLTGLANAFSNMTATTNPTVNSDQTQGYSVGSTWFNTTTNVVYVCADAATGAAVWSQIPAFPITIAQGGTGSTTKNFVDLTTNQTVAGIKNFTGSPTFNNISTGAWTSYPVLWTGAVTDPDIGNGSISSSYSLIGKTCTFQITITSGTTTTYGSGNYTFTMPFNNTAGVTRSGGSGQVVIAGTVRSALVASYGQGANTMTLFGATSSSDPRLTQLSSSGIAGSSWTAATAGQTIRFHGVFETA